MTENSKRKLALLAGVGLTIALAWLVVAVTVSAGEEGLNLPLKRYELPQGVQPATLPTTVEISTAPGVVVLEGADPWAGLADGLPDLLRAIAGGDVNGDGFEDLILGAEGANPGGRWDAGEVYVVFGRGVTLPTPIVVSDSADVIIEGIDDGDFAGGRLASGDFDGDGYDDVIVGAPFASPGGRAQAGEVYVVYGSSGLAGTVVVSTAAEVAILEGIDGGDNAGLGLTSGDVDRDGYDDVLVGAPWASPGGRTGAGEAYVVYGRNRLTGRHEISTTTDVLILEGVDDFDQAGAPLRSGDLDRDGYDDVGIGTPFASPGGRVVAGEAYVVYGRSRLTGTHQISTTTATDVLVVEGVDDGDRAGSSLAGGDVNGDGHHDLVIGARGAAPGGRLFAGEIYVLFGQGPRLSGTVQISTAANVAILEGVDGFDGAGRAVFCRDANNDHFADLVIGAPWADPGGRLDAGEVYVVYGRADLSGTVPISTPGSIVVSTIQGVDDFDETGARVGVIDLNNDQGGEIVVGAGWADPGGRTDAGEVYVIYSYADKYWSNLPIIMNNNVISP